MQARLPLRILIVFGLVSCAAVIAGSASAQDPASAFPPPEDPFENEATPVAGGGGDAGSGETLPSDFLAPGMTDLPGFLDAMELERGTSEELVDGIAAQVGGGVVLVSEVHRLAAPIEARMRKAGATESELRSMRAEALERLIESRIIDDMVERYQLSTTDAEIDKAVAMIAGQNGLSLEQLRASIASHGLSVEDYRAKLKQDIERSNLLRMVVSQRVKVEEKEVEALYKRRYGSQRTSGSEVHLRHLLVASGGEGKPDEAAACRIVEGARQQVVSGATSFEEAASRLSDNNRERGGDLGWVYSGELASWMAPAIVDLEPGQVSQVVPMYFGCNLLMVVDRREVTAVTLEQARPELQQQLGRRKEEEEYVRFIEKVRKTVYIERKGPFAEATRLEDRSASR
jgi:peptidyl-prolyl cis-trans isomerase SurA